MRANKLSLEVDVNVDDDEEGEHCQGVLRNIPKRESHADMVGGVIITGTLSLVEVGTLMTERWH